MDIATLCEFILTRFFSLMWLMALYLILPGIIVAVICGSAAKLAETPESGIIRGPFILLLLVLLVYTVMSMHRTEASVSTRNYLSKSYSEYKRESDIQDRNKRTQVDIASGVYRFALVDFKRPMHVYIGIQDVESRTYLKDLYIGKYCNGYEQNTVGQEYNLRVRKWRWSDEPPTTVHYDFQDLKSAFCS